MMSVLSMRRGKAETRVSIFKISMRLLEHGKGRSQSRHLSRQSSSYCLVFSVVLFTSQPRFLFSLCIISPVAFKSLHNQLLVSQLAFCFNPSRLGLNQLALQSRMRKAVREQLSLRWGQLCLAMNHWSQQKTYPHTHPPQALPLQSPASCSWVKSYQTPPNTLFYFSISLGSLSSEMWLKVEDI